MADNLKSISGSNPAPPLKTDELDVVDLEAVRLILRGGSAINWYRTGFSTAERVVQFLRVNGYDVDVPHDVDRLRAILRKSADFIGRNFGYTFPQEIHEPTRVEDLFLLASSSGAHQKLACMVLKAANVINHLEGYELRHTR